MSGQKVETPIQKAKASFPERAATCRQLPPPSKRHKRTMRWTRYRPLHSKPKQFKHAICAAVNNNAASLQRKEGPWDLIRHAAVPNLRTAGCQRYPEHSRALAIHFKFTAICVRWRQPTKRNCFRCRVSLMSSSSAQSFWLQHSCLFKHSTGNTAAINCHCKWEYASHLASLRPKAQTSWNKKRKKKLPLQQVPIHSPFQCKKEREESFRKS